MSFIVGAVAGLVINASAGDGLRLPQQERARGPMAALMSAATAPTPAQLMAVQRLDDRWAANIPISPNFHSPPESDLDAVRFRLPFNTQKLTFGKVFHHQVDKLQILNDNFRIDLLAGHVNGCFQMGFCCDDRTERPRQAAVVVLIGPLRPYSHQRRQEGDDGTGFIFALFFWRYRFHGKWCGEPVQYAPPQDAVSSPVKWIPPRVLILPTF